MTDNSLPCFLQFEFNGERDMPLRYYMDRVSRNMGEYEVALYAKMEPFMANDIPTPAVMEHSFCCRVLKCKCKCPSLRPSYNYKLPIKMALSIAKPENLSGIVERWCDWTDQNSNVMILWKPLQSGLYEWTKWNFTYDMESRGLGRGSMKDSHYHLVQYN